MFMSVKVGARKILQFLFFGERPADTRFYKKIGLEQRILFNKILVCRVWVIPDRDEKYAPFCLEGRKVSKL